jgi:hypothetical protein
MDFRTVLIELVMPNKREGVTAEHPIGVTGVPRVGNLKTLRLTARANPMVFIPPEMKPTLLISVFRVSPSAVTTLIGAYVLHRRRVSTSATALKILTLCSLLWIYDKYTIRIYIL